MMVNHRGEPMLSPRRPVFPRKSAVPSAVPTASAAAARRPKSTRKYADAMADEDPWAKLYPLKKKQRSGDADDDDDVSGVDEVFAEPATPFDEHLRAIYEDRADADGLAFFSSHGYYDVDDANTVAMFRQNFGLRAFWLDDDDDDVDNYEDGQGPNNDVSDADLDCMYPLGSLSQALSASSLRFTKQRTMSGRFTLLDDEGNEVDEDAALELEREERLEVRSRALDAHECAQLEREQLVAVAAVAAIRSEKAALQRMWFQAFREEQARTVSAPSPILHAPLRTVLPPASAGIASDTDLPPFCGNVHVLRESTPFLFASSWRKRWFCLDFQEGTVTMFKRSYWKAPRGLLDLRTVARVERMNQSDFRIEFLDRAQSTLMLRAKNADDADLWVNLLTYARRQARARGGVAPRAELSTAIVLAKSRASGKKPSQIDMYARILQMSAQASPAPAEAADRTSSHARPTLMLE